MFAYGGEVPNSGIFEKSSKAKQSQTEPIQFNTCQYINMLLYIYNFPKCSMPSKYLIKSPHKSQHIFVGIYNAHTQSTHNTHTEWLHALAFDFSFRWFIVLAESLHCTVLLHMPSIFLLFCVLDNTVLSFACMYFVQQF